MMIVNMIIRSFDDDEEGTRMMMMKVKYFILTTGITRCFAILCHPVISVVIVTFAFHGPVFTTLKLVLTF